MVAYSRCKYSGLTPSSMAAISAAHHGHQLLTGSAAMEWRARGKCPLTPKETAFILQSLGIPIDTPIYLAAGDSIMELEGLTSVYPHVHTKSTLLRGEDFVQMGGNTKAALDYYVSTNSEAYIATFFGNMDKMVSVMRAMQGRSETLALNRRAFAAAAKQNASELARAMWNVHRDDYAMRWGSALPDCFCEHKVNILRGLHRGCQVDSNGGHVSTGIDLGLTQKVAISDKIKVWDRSGTFEEVWDRS